MAKVGKCEYCKATRILKNSGICKRCNAKEVIVENEEETN